MPTYINNDGEVHGSVICQDPKDSDLELNFYTSPLINKEKKNSNNEEIISYPHKLKK